VEISSLYGWASLALTAAAWLLNGALTGLRTHLLFFPLWLGYILAADALVFVRRGHSLFTRPWKHALLLFAFSVPVWWLFELINLRTQNWVYLGREQFRAFSYFCFSSLNFSTVIPAVFETVELASTFRWIQRLRNGPRLHADHRMFAAGGIMLGLLLLFPRFFYPFVWLSLFCLIEPLNHRFGISSLWNFWERGDWRPATALGIGSLICGFFWEMWNLHSFPKWIYQIPFFGFWKVFEMPLFGYLGYPAFALELFALYRLACGLLGTNPANQIATEPFQPASC
jgi:hypothetical protein